MYFFYLSWMNVSIGRTICGKSPLKFGYCPEKILGGTLEHLRLSLESLLTCSFNASSALFTRDRFPLISIQLYHSFSYICLSTKLVNVEIFVC